MEKYLEEIRLEIIRLIKSINNSDWKNAEIIIEFPPFINKGYNTLPSFWDKENNRVRLFLDFDDKFNNLFFTFLFLFNQEKKYNQLVFSTKRDSYEEATISISFNQKIEDSFQNNLPKSKRGKTLPWWKIESETVGLGSIS